MLTINPEVVKVQRKTNDCFTVRLRFTLNRRMKRISTSLFATPNDLTKNYKIKASAPIKQDIDALIHSYYDKCAKLQIELNNYTLDDVMNYLNGEQEKQQTIDFIKFSREWIASTTIKGAPNYTTAINALVRFIGKEELDINLITLDFLESFKAFLNKEREIRTKRLMQQGKRVPSNRSLSLYLISIKKLFNEAKKKYNKKEKNLILIPNSPFMELEIPKQEATRKRAISAKDILKIYEMPYLLDYKGRERVGRFNLAKDCFILSFGLIGMNSADLYSCEDIKEDVITYFRAKTSARRNDKAKMKVKVMEVIKPLVEKYRDRTGKRVFNFYQHYSTADAFNKAINYGLKQIGGILQIEDLEYYAARHSWATLAVNKVGIDKYTVHAALSHIDEAMKVTDIYIERDFEVENEANRKVLEYVFGWHK